MAPLGAVKYLIYSMNALKPATATTACAGIRRMEFSQPLPSSLGTAGAHGHLAGMRGCGLGSAEVVKRQPGPEKIRKRRAVRCMVRHPNGSMAPAGQQC